MARKISNLIVNVSGRRAVLRALQRFEDSSHTKLHRPFHFSARYLKQHQIDDLVVNGFARETGVIGMFKLQPCYQLTEKGSRYGRPKKDN